ncbi:ComEA family DNA-binding protein [Pseudonocardia acaciae]|uniref:ComEA family DNA-binding protein n=1 Tax=Pseudonocardia acaciae TaxID=551276 RepID=UPI0009FE960C|nr:ComEA family DNA-binding protein [Pseudonocardia acaciae]
MTTARSDVSTEQERSAAERLAALRAARGSPGAARARGDTARPAERRPSPRAPGARTKPAPTDTAPLPVLPAPPRSLTRLLERWLPSAWRGARLDPGRPGALALVIVAVLAAVLATVAVWRSRPVAEPAPALAVATPAVETAPSVPAPARAPTAGQPLVISVAGKVRRPGLVRLPDGSRVADAIAQAGGPTRDADLTTLNLARRLTDGEQILVGLPQPAEAAAGAPASPSGGPGAAAPPSTGGKVDLNRATLEQLDTLPGIGRVTAQRILDWRTQHGRFTSIEQLREVEGIGERRFGQLRAQVTI